FKNKIPSNEIVEETIYQIVKENLASLEHQPKCIQLFVRETPTSYLTVDGQIYRVSSFSNG
ncbi:hypothetical protein VXR67_13990, partial [Staphylococcus aureus]